MKNLIARMRGDKAVDSATITTIIMLPTFLIIGLVVIASIMWHSYIRTPVEAMTQTYTDLYANLGTNTPARYQGTTVTTVTGKASEALSQIVYVEPGYTPQVVCGMTDPTSTATITTWETDGTPVATTLEGIWVPGAGEALPANAPVTCAASVRLRPWPFQGGWNALNNLLGGGYITYGTGFSDGGGNANVN